MTDDLIDVTLAVAAALDRCGIPYTVGGSLASSLSGEPRASLDADVVVQIRPDQIDGLVNLLGDDFYADRDAIGAPSMPEAVRTSFTVPPASRSISFRQPLFSTISSCSGGSLSR